MMAVLPFIVIGQVETFINDTAILLYRTMSI